MVAELVDARDLKSRDSNIVWVRFPPAAHTLESLNHQVGHLTKYVKVVDYFATAT